MDIVPYIHAHIVEVLCTVQLAVSSDRTWVLIRQRSNKVAARTLSKREDTKHKKIKK